ncbi:MAG: formylglycine-generating enzyme family protein, partial [Pedobacter sp.]
MKRDFYLFILLLLVCFSCNQPEQSKKVIKVLDDATCSGNLPDRFGTAAKTAVDTTVGSAALTGSTKGMKLIKGGEFVMGASDKEGRSDEYPAHRVVLSDFYIDQHEVTNAQFAAFVKATGYVTVAERKPDWEELKKQLPPGTPKPADELLVAASLVFNPPNHPVNLNNAAQWWA